jgi:hypothetical protein
MIKSIVRATTVAQVAASAAGTWELANFDRVTNVGGVYATSAAECFAAYTDNAGGPGVARTKDEGTSWELYAPNGWLNTDTARDKLGNEIITTIGAIFASHGDSAYEAIEGKDISYSQNVETFGEQTFAVAGTHYPNGVLGEVVNGVALSNDGGVSWSYHDTGLPWNVYVSRYGAYPSSKTWYVAQGSWSNAASIERSPSVNSTRIDTWGMTSRLTMHSKGISVASKESVTATGCAGAISKTTDGGKTFKTVYDTKGQFYFNEIDCSSESVCMAVAENGETAIVLRTENGGEVWKQVMSYTAPAGGSLMGCKMLSDSEAWVSGGTLENGALTGHYYHTTNGGQTWELQTLPQAFSMDLSFAGGVGYSTAVAEFSSGVAVLKNNLQKKT